MTMNGMINAQNPGSSWESVWKAGLQPGQVLQSTPRPPGFGPPATHLTWSPPPTSLRYSAAQSYIALYVVAQKFDLGNVSKPLAKLLHEGSLDVKGKRAFIPGCG